MKKKKKVRKRIRWKVILLFVAVILICSSIYFYVSQIPVQRILIHGTKYTSDNDIIMATGLKNYPNLMEIHTRDLKQKVLEIPTVEKVNVSKSLFGSVVFDIEEAKPLFYNRNTGKIAFSNGQESILAQASGVPTLVNYVPDVYYKRLLNELNKLDEDVLRLISEIEYQPWKNGEVIIDETRFFLRMTDGNQVFVNLIHMDKLNNYMQIYATLENKKGYLYLDSSSDKISFSLTREEEKEKDVHHE